MYKVKIRYREMNGNNTDAPSVKNKLVGCDGYMRIGGAYITGKLGKYNVNSNRRCDLKDSGV
jgi:hypothetical protein